MATNNNNKTNSLVSFYKEGVSKPQLHEGVYDVTLTKHALVTTNPANPYIALEFTTENGRVLKENRFNNGFQIMVSHLKQQLNKGDEEIGVMDFLNELVTKKTPFKIWITKYTPANGGQTRSNFNFLEPRKNNSDSTGVTVTNDTDQSTEDEVEDAI